MTDFTPQIRVMYLPPNSSHLDPRSEITDLIDYSISAARGSSEYISAPYPAQTVVNLLFDANVIPDIQIGTWLEIQVYSVVSLDYEILHSGYVTDRQSTYRAYGLTGFVLEWQFSLTSAISDLQNSIWFNETALTAGTVGCLDKTLQRSYRTMWNEVNANTQWQDYGPVSWDDVDQKKLDTFPTISYSSESTSQHLSAGYRNTWDDITTLVYGIYGWIWEQPNGDIEIEYQGTPISSTITLTQDMLSPDIMGGDSIGKIRNTVTITEFDGIESTYYDDNSINLHNQRPGTLSTYLTNTLDAANVGQTILNGLAYPLLSTEQISVNLLNPIFTDSERELLLFSPIGRRITVEAPIPMGGTLDYLTIGCQFDINKDSFVLSLTLAPYSQAYNSPNWDQIPYNYTWTSYGVAFPTQEWQDL